MRPSAFTDGYQDDPRPRACRAIIVGASMRPSAFTDGYVPDVLVIVVGRPMDAGFNEAVGFHRRIRADDHSLR